MLTGPRFFVLEPPYISLRPIEPTRELQVSMLGTAMVWFLTAAGINAGESEQVERRPRGMSLAIILPPADEIAAVASHLHRIGGLDPNAVLPGGDFATPNKIRMALAGLPRNLPAAVSNYLWRHRLVTSITARNEIRRIFELAPRTSTINRLCRDLYLSRRTLGRHFESCGLPVPSHWLQFARVLNVMLRAQCERQAVFKIALSAGYPDGFTLSNQLKRMTGFRPSEIRHYLGFEWLLERWLEMERIERGESLELRDEATDES
jgi:AraC-like DNA-binding protein